MGSFIDILDTQKKFEFQGISNFKDSEFEETKCIKIGIINKTIKGNKIFKDS